MLGDAPTVNFFVHRSDNNENNNSNQPLDVTHYTALRSTFSSNKHASTSSIDVARKGILSDSRGAGDDSSREKERLEQHMADIRSQLSRIEQSMAQKRNELKSAQDEVNQMKATKTELMKQLNAPKDIERKLTSEQNKKHDLEQRLTADVEQQKKELLNRYEQSVKQLLAKVNDMLKSNRVVIDLKIEKTIASVMKTETQTEVRAATEKLLEAKESLKNLQQAVRVAQQARAESEREKNRAEEELNRFIAHYGGVEPFGVLYTEKVEPMCVENTSAELESKCLQLENELDSIVDNPEVVRRYHELQAQLAVLTAEVEECQKTYDSSSGSLETQSAKWLSAVKQIATKLDVLFSKFMSDLQYRGEVSLLETGTIDQHEISMKVSFRGESDLVPLSGNRHSGGERAVSTIMYLMALQNMTSVPFRVVDEINQGMDERNERLVFDRIVHSCCGGGHSSSSSSSSSTSTKSSSKPPPQYFLVSPKLLPGLKAMSHPDVTVLLVMNGTGLHFDWISKRLLSNSSHSGGGCVGGKRTNNHSNDNDDDDEDEDEDMVKTTSTSAATISSKNKKLKSSSSVVTTATSSSTMSGKENQNNRSSSSSSSATTARVSKKDIVEIADDDSDDEDF